MGNDVKPKQMRKVCMVIANVVCLFCVLCVCSAYFPRLLFRLVHLPVSPTHAAKSHSQILLLFSDLTRINNALRAHTHANCARFSLPVY